MVLLKRLFLKICSYNLLSKPSFCSLVQMQWIAKTCLFATFAVDHPAMIVNIYRTAANVLYPFAKTAENVVTVRSVMKRSVLSAKC